VGAPGELSHRTGQEVARDRHLKVAAGRTVAVAVEQMPRCVRNSAGLTVDGQQELLSQRQPL
jgi:hypothetical protein